MHQDQEFYPRDDEIDLFQLFENLFQEKLLIIGMTILTGLIAVVVSFILPKTFSAEVSSVLPLPLVSAST
ncbi:Wzz/FepE/Etk N-terminal domain-containing protein [Endozoicomonas gorgoniicola]|uniref:Wzz/FepE/Etk N-terminal domain-containing protein n=1 Tax=Endozoicomonas gorgoniicola TaxID=1234144 RepID=UPI00389914AE